VTTLWRELYDDARARLGSVADARRIVERAAGFDGAAFHAGLSEPVPARARPFFEEMVCRRAAGEPLQYVLGRWAFRTLDLYVDSRVLIPRPETEGLVDVAMIELGKLAVPAPVVVDLGTGSGAIALSFAKEVPGAEVYATDRSAGALAVARANLAGLGTAATRVRLLEGSWYRALPPLLRGRVHLVASNPPYVADDEELDPEVAEWEPVAALRAGPTGLEQVQVVVGEAPAWLARPGALVVEIAPNHADAASALAHGAGFVEVEVRPDLAGRDRVLVARM